MHKGIFSHYKWLEVHLMPFFEKVGIKDPSPGIISAHGDKFYQYRPQAEVNSIPFCHMAAVGLLTYTSEFGKECRETANGWVAPVDWIVGNYDRFREHLPPVDETDPRYLILRISLEANPMEIQRKLTGVSESLESDDPATRDDDVDSGRIRFGNNRYKAPKAAKQRRYAIAKKSKQLQRKKAKRK